MFRASFRLLKLPKPVQRIPASHERFNLCVIGGGPAGLTAAIQGVRFGKRVCLIEEKCLGGTDLWGGSVPSKVLWELGTTVSRLNDSEFSHRFFSPGVGTAVKNAIDEQKVFDSIRGICLEREKHFEEFLDQSGVTRIQGKAAFTNDHELDVKSEGTGEYHTITSDNFVIATGCSPIPLLNYPFDHETIVTHSDMFRLPIPSSLVIVGGGILGCEFASIFAQLGKTRVYLIDHRKRIMTNEDDDVAGLVESALKASGVTIFNDSNLFDLEPHTLDDGQKACRFSVQNNRGGLVETFTVDRALVSVGRRPNLHGLGLENTNIKVSNGAIVQDVYNHCLPYDNIYSIGDVSSSLRVVNMAQAAARVTVNNIFGHTESRVVNPNLFGNVSTVMFFGQEVACIGLNEKQCREQGIAYIVAKVQCNYLTRPIILGQREGFVKLIVSNDAEKRVLGARAVCPHASSVVEVVSLAIRKRESVHTLLRLNMSYPSVSQAMMECVLTLVDTSGITSAKGVTVSHWEPSDCVACEMRSV